MPAPQTPAWDPPELTCYVQDGWNIDIHPAPATRDWMDASPVKYAYRCLPLDIANSHGWEIRNPCPFTATWDGGPHAAAISFDLAPEVPLDIRPLSIFGMGTLTFHMFGLFRTSPGWNLWIGGPPNHLKHGIGALTGILETDWSVFSFTMNWRFTAPGAIRFEKDEPFCHVFPVQRDVLNRIEPKRLPLRDDPDLMRDYQEWSASRAQFHAAAASNPPGADADQWQKHYFQGRTLRAKCPVSNHQSKLRLRGFE